MSHPTFWTKITYDMSHPTCQTVCHGHYFANWHFCRRDCFLLTRMTRSDCEYMARATLILCFCPPLRLMPCRNKHNQMALYDAYSIKQTDCHWRILNSNPPFILSLNTSFVTRITSRYNATLLTIGQFVLSYLDIVYCNTDFTSQILYINILVDWSLSGIMTSKLIICESESPRPAASSILISNFNWTMMCLKMSKCAKVKLKFSFFLGILDIEFFIFSLSFKNWKINCWKHKGKAIYIVHAHTHTHTYIYAKVWAKICHHVSPRK